MQQILLSSPKREGKKSSFIPEVKRRNDLKGKDVKDKIGDDHS